MLTPARELEWPACAWVGGRDEFRMVTALLSWPTEERQWLYLDPKHLCREMLAQQASLRVGIGEGRGLIGEFVDRSSYLFMLCVFSKLSLVRKKSKTLFLFRSGKVSRTVLLLLKLGTGFAGGVGRPW